MRFWKKLLSKEIWNLLQWDTETRKITEGKNKIPIDIESLHTKREYSSAISSDKRLQALNLTDGIAILDRSAGKEVRRLKGIKNPIFVAFALDGQSVLTFADYDNTEWAKYLQVWSVETGKPRISLLISEWMLEAWEAARAFALSPDGRYVAYVRNQVHVIEVASGFEIVFNPGEGNPLDSMVTWSPDGCFLAGGEQGEVWLWDMMLGREVGRFAGHSAKVRALAFSPNRLRLVSGSDDATALVWDLHSLSLPEVETVQLPSGNELWASLGTTNLADAFRTIRLLTNTPDKALPLLRKRLLLVPPDSKLIKRASALLAQLDADDFKTRQQAKKLLVEMGAGIEPVLREALIKNPSFEVCQSINQVLDKLLGPRLDVPSRLHTGQLQVCRGVEVLERIGTPAARQILEELSGLPKGIIQQEEAKAALYRLSKLVPLQVP